jgi:tetratricopeptide (TPR) repeat protein
LQGDLKEAIDYFNQAQEIYVTLNYRLHTADILTSFGHLHVSKGEDQMAKPLFLQAREHCEDLGCRRGFAACDVLIARLEADEGNSEEAKVRYRQAASVYLYMGDASKAEDCLSMANEPTEILPKWMHEVRK